MAEGAQALQRFARTLTQERQRIRADRRALHERLGARMLTGVRGQIRGKLNDAHGHVRGWQSKYIGSGGGYAAVRAVDGASGPDSPGAITNYLENGHERRLPSGKSKRRYKAKINVVRVAGRKFYDGVRPSLERMLQSEVDRWARDIVRRLEG